MLWTGMVWKLTACQIHSQVHLEPAQTFLAQTQVVLKVEVLQTTYAPTQHKKTARGLLKMLTKTQEQAQVLK